MFQLKELTLMIELKNQNGPRTTEEEEEVEKEEDLIWF